MPVPDSFAVRRYGGREESSFSNFSQTRSATRPGLISSSYTSKLSAATLPPRSTFERRVSSDNVSRYLATGSRTIPNYGSSSIRGSASPSRASTITSFRQPSSVSDRFKSYDTSNGEREFVSRFLKPRESTVAPLSSTSKSNGYLPRDRSGSRDSGFSTPTPGLGARERDRNIVRGNIATRAASIGPSSVSRACRNGSTKSISFQSSTEVTSSSKSNASSTISSGNVSRGATPPVPLNAPNHAAMAELNETCSKLENNRNDSALTIPITVETPIGDVGSSSSAQSGFTNGYPSNGVNGNERGKGQSVKMVTELDSNGNDMSNPTSCGDVPLERKSIRSKGAKPKVILHKIEVMTDEKSGKAVSSPESSDKDGNKGAERRQDNKSSVTPSAENKSNRNDFKRESSTKSAAMNRQFRKGNDFTGPTASAGYPSKLTPAKEFEPLKEEESKRPGQERAKSSPRSQSPSPVRQSSGKLKGTPSKSPLVVGSRHQSSPPAQGVSLTRKQSNTTLVGSESTRSGSPSTSGAILKSRKPSGPVPAASREQSLSRSPSPHSSSVPQPPPLPDLHLNGKCDVDGAMTGRPNIKLGEGRHAGTSRGPQSDSDNDADTFTASPTLGGRFRSSGERQSDSDKEAGLSGLRNIGNTCFMNSVLQCLSNTKPLLEYIMKKSYSGEINTSTSAMKGALMRAFADLCHELWRDSKSTVDTSAFKDQIQKFAPRFMGYSQQDAQEFLRYLLEGLHEDINRVDTKPAPILTEIDDSLSDSVKASQSWKRYLRADDSKIVDLFVGQLKSTLKCTTCGHCSVTFDPFWDLSLPIPSKTGQVKLSQCLELFTKEEILDGDEKPTCSKCNARRKCTKSFTIQRFPRILVIHLKRFSPTERYRGKLSTTVDFPLQSLDMAPYAASRSLGCTYNLYGVANHSGSTYSGHYVAYCKHPYLGDWHCYNDSRVSPMSSQSVVSSDGYLLFYELSSSQS